jgi:hypothetical protein
MLRNHGLHVKENHNPPHIDKCKKHGPRFLRLKKSLFPDPKKPQIRSTWTHGWDSRNPRWGPKRILRRETEMEDHTHFGKCKTHPRQFRVTEAWKQVSSSSEFIHSSPPNPEPQQGSNGLELSTYGRIRENGMEGMERRIEKSSYGLNQISYN